jgi:hypothetical protein
MPWRPAERTPTTRRIDGTLEGDHIGRAEVHGLINPHTRRWSLSGLVEGCQLTQESLRSLPSDWLEGRRLPGRFQSRVTFQYKVSGGEAGGFPCHFQVSGRLVEGRIEDARLPGPVTELEADFQVDNEGLTVTGAAGRVGQSAFAIHSLRTWGFDSASRKSIDAQVQSLELNRDLLAVLPDDYRETLVEVPSQRTREHCGLRGGIRRAEMAPAEHDDRVCRRFLQLLQVSVPPVPSAGEI